MSRSRTERKERKRRPVRRRDGSGGRVRDGADGRSLSRSGIHRMAPLSPVDLCSGVGGSSSVLFSIFFPLILSYVMLYMYIILRRFFSSSSSSSYYYYPRNGGLWWRNNHVEFILRYLQYLLLLLLYLHDRLSRGPRARRMFSRAAVTREPSLVSCLQYVQSRRNHIRRDVFGALGKRKNAILIRMGWERV